MTIEKLIESNECLEEAISRMAQRTEGIRIDLPTPPEDNQKHHGEPVRSGLDNVIHVQVMRLRDSITRLTIFTNQIDL